MNLYKMLWSRIGGRPWTYIIRDIWNEAEWLIQTIWIFAGVCLGWFLSMSFQIFPIVSLLLVLKWAGIIWGIYTFGYINGHLFWGTKWIKGQRGE